MYNILTVMKEGDILEINKKEIANKIRAMRQERGMTMDEFGKLIGTNKYSVSNWENAKNLPNNERLKSIAEIADVTVENLLYGDPIPIDDDLIKKFKNYTREKNDFIGQEMKLLWPAAKSGATFGLGFKKEQDQAIKNRIKHDKRIEELEKFGFRYIIKNFDNYTYEKYLEEYPNSNLQEFTEFKEKQWHIFKEKLDEYWESLINTANYYSWINKGFTDQIAEELNKISSLAIEEGKEDYYINEVIQPFLDQAAKDFKEYIKENTDIEE